MRGGPTSLRFMRRALHHVCSLMIAVMLATILAPSFAWEVSQTKASHADPEGVDERHASSEEEKALGEEDPHVLYGCAGHVLGHLASVTQTHNALHPEPAIQARIPERPQHHPQQFPVRLERPPSPPVRT